MTTTNKNNKKSFRFILTKSFVVDCYNEFSNEQEAKDWVNKKVSDGEFEDLAEEIKNAPLTETDTTEDWEILEIDENGEVI